MENEHTWRVSIDQIKESGYNLDIKNPHVEDEDHGDPIELLARYQKIVSEVIETREKLKQELAACLKGRDS
ncbi:hypothetical protein KSK55_03890 [Methanospirillum purgamenti]|uniref:DNA methylase adenine-specific domain-containing protein n=1 Tax=Methanospirillum hungatei TaxID=2203 RepID=A0A8F5VM16_METHU|nr:hypothetical protein [Methanospirillum hungatei]QXO95551.1 hypothetical protein KSK55_03890 [Methanospirillum hungatei]